MEARENSAQKDQRQMLLKCKLTLVISRKLLFIIYHFCLLVHTKNFLAIIKNCIAHARKNSRAPS